MSTILRRLSPSQKRLLAVSSMLIDSVVMLRLRHQLISFSQLLNHSVRTFSCTVSDAPAHGSKQTAIARLKHELSLWPMAAARPLVVMIVINVGGTGANAGLPRK